MATTEIQGECHTVTHRKERNTESDLMKLILNIIEPKTKSGAWLIVKEFGLTNVLIRKE